MNALIGGMIGLFAGVMAGIAGVGGGVVMVPAMTEILGLEQQIAQGTSLLAILFTSVSGTWVNVRNRRGDLKAALVIGLAGLVAAQFGSQLALATDQALLRRLFGLLVLVSGVRMIVRWARDRRSADAGPA
ncbi:MAG: sulfite exporter TauE/SafE family protein [Acidimicrobiia bacterium]|nr:sulfite exporter TauE/SafE family protein [Acidimicrobiia bacterium]